MKSKKFLLLTAKAGDKVITNELMSQTIQEKMEANFREHELFPGEVDILIQKFGSIYDYVQSNEYKNERRKTYIGFEAKNARRQINEGWETLYELYGD